MFRDYENKRYIKNIIVGPAHPLRGGIADFNETLCRSFNNSGTNSKIISYYLQYPDFLFPGKTQLDDDVRPSDIKIESLLSSVNPLSWRRTAKKIVAENPDYILLRLWMPFFAPCLGTIARIVKRKSNIKVIVIADNIVPHEKRFGDRLLTKYLLNNVDGYVVMTDNVMQDLLKFIPQPKAILLPHPIYDIFGEKITREDALTQLNLRQNFRYILFFGFVRKYKGLDLLLEAMTDHRVKSLNIKLLIAGEFYDDMATYMDFIRNNELENNVIVKSDYIPSSNVRSYFCAADLIVQPYKTATQSGVTQIAYHFDRPMLVTDVGGLAEMVPHLKVGYVLPPEPESIAGAIAHFFHNDLEAEFSKNVSIEKKRFSWSSFTEGIANFVKQLP